MDTKKKILIVEDDRSINRLIAYNLGKEGYSVESIYDGLEAEERVKQEHFDVIILDIMLPGRDGFSICRAIRENAASFKTFIMVISAKNFAQDKLYAHILGADCYMSKPLDIRMLVKTVREFSGFSEHEFLVEKH